MTIGIDASRYNQESGTGVELYSVKIINGLIEYFKHHPDHNIVLYSPRKLMLYKTHKIQHRVMPFKRLWTKVRLSIEMLFHKPDVLFVPSHVLPHFCPKKSIITIHDTAFMHLKKEYGKREFWYLKKTTKYAVKKASSIIVPSEATKKDLMRFFGCPAEKIHVIHHGTDFKPKKFHADFDTKTLEQLGLRRFDNFFLFIGRLESKKNLSRLIEAFGRFHDTFKNFKLVLAGRRGTGFSKILKTAQKFKLMDCVLMPGYILENEKHVLLKYCNAFVFPSLYEGFGFPILEAFSYQKPVITSNSASIPEVAGDAAILVNPHDTDEIAECMKKLITDPKIKEKLLANAENQLKKFNWEISVIKTIKVLVT
ncbi:glycosyltransferase family 4 protein [Candidatus Peregrinibacteria bacterium]|nr:glycosyltransferase family 4 protein [Candidatus Peregrinibacteria bacterium]